MGRSHLRGAGEGWRETMLGLMFLGDPALCIPRSGTSCGAGRTISRAHTDSGRFGKTAECCFSCHTKEPEQLELNRILLIGISSNADGAN